MAPSSEGLELNVAMTESVKSIKSSKPKSTRTKPSSAELEEFCKSLSKCNVKPVCLSLEKPYAGSFILKTRNIGSVSDLFDPKLMDLNYIDPLKECHKVKLNLTPEEIALIEGETVEQSRSNAFFPLVPQSPMLPFTPTQHNLLSH